MSSSFPQALLDAVPAALAIADAKSHGLLAANSNFAQYVGIPIAQLSSMALADALPPADRGAITEMLDRLDAKNPVELGHVTLGTRHTVPELDLQLQFVDASPSLVVAILRDPFGSSSERDCNARNTALLRAIPDSIYRLDPNGVIVDHKPEQAGKRERQTELPEVGTSFFALATRGIDQSSLRDAVDRAIETGQLQRVEFEATCLGKRRVYEARFVAEDTGKVVAIVRDLTDLVQNQENLSRIGKLEALGTLAGGIAHDFNNLVTGSFGHVEMAREYIIEDKATRAVDCLNEATRSFGRARELTRQLLTFSKSGTPHKVPGDLPSVVQRTARAALTNANVTLQVEPPSELPPVSFDETQITQVIENLVTNACDAMAQGGSLVIAFSILENAVGSTLPLPLGNYVVVSVKDTGTGIPLENMPKLFDPFFTTKQNGTGLGLPSAFSIVKRHGGHLDIQSELGNGTTCHVYLPIDAETKVEPAKLVSNRPTRQGRVLVMDDEDAVRRVTSSFLMRLGYEVSLAVDGGEAIDIYRRTLRAGQPFAFVILDLTVPGGLGGRETLETLRGMDPGVTAIATSGYSNDPILTNPESFGFRAGLAKPYSRQEFLNLIGRVTGA